MHHNSPHHRHHRHRHRRLHHHGHIYLVAIVVFVAIVFFAVIAVVIFISTRSHFAGMPSASTAVAAAFTRICIWIPRRGVKSPQRLPWAPKHMEDLPDKVPEDHYVEAEPGDVMAPMTEAGGAPAVAGAGVVPVPLEASEGEQTAGETGQVEPSMDAGSNEAVVADAVKLPEAADLTATEYDKGELANAGGGGMAAVAADASPPSGCRCSPSPAAR